MDEDIKGGEQREGIGFPGLLLIILLVHYKENRVLLKMGGGWPAHQTGSFRKFYQNFSFFWEKLPLSNFEVFKLVYKELGGYIYVKMV